MGASGLVRSAGSALPAERPSFEQLERRQMLFSLAISADSVDPATGLGTARAFVGYYIPYLATSVTVTPAQATTVTESFDQVGYGAIGSGGILNQSGLQFIHNINPPSDIAVTARPQTNDNNSRWVRVNPDEGGEFFALRFWTTGTTTPTRVAVQQASMDIRGDSLAVGGDNTGILTDQSTVNLYYNNQLVVSYTGAAIRARLTAFPGNPNSGPAFGTGNLQLRTPTGTAFDEVRVTLQTPLAPGSSVAPAFEVDNISYTVPGGTFAALLTSRAYGFEAALSGPVGATVSFSDLYGRDLQKTLGVIPLAGSSFNPGDLNDDGIPDFNDGIGAIRFSGTDSRTSFTMMGGKLATATTLPEGADSDRTPISRLVPNIYWESLTGVTWTIVDDPKGLYDEFETNGFGYAGEIRGTTFVVTGLPPGSGSVIVGSPIVRDLNAYNPAFLPGGTNIRNAQVTSGFTNPGQGVFITDGGSIGSINIPGMVFGASSFNGYVNRFAVGNLMGSISVAGDIGSIIVASDAGIWSPDPTFTAQSGLRLDPNNKTNAQIVIGRTAGQILIGGRSQMDVTIVGDLNSPTTAPQRNSAIYDELEAYSGAGVTAAKAIGLATAYSDVTLNYQPSTSFGRTGGQPIVFGTNFFRNDSILGAEIVTGQSGGVRIRGELSDRDAFLGEDDADVYGFAVDGSQTINIQGDIVNGASVGGSPAALYYRVVDSDGNVVAAPARTARKDRFVATNLSFKPSAPGMYYLVVTDPNGSEADGDTGAGATPYSIAITGLATASLGSYRTGAGQGFTDRNSGEGSSVSVLSGNIGSIRLGTGYLSATAAPANPTEVTNTVQSADDSMSWQGGSISTPGTVYNITTGSDIGAPNGFTSGTPVITVSIGGDLGNLVTGLSPLFDSGLTGASGDVNFLTLNVGGRIGMLDIRGAVGFDQDNNAPRTPSGPNALNVFTGLAGGTGDIGMIRIGFHVAGDSMNVTTPAHSVIGGLLVSQASTAVYDDGNARSGIYLGSNGINLNTGVGSDVRFADTPRIDLTNSVDVTYPILGGTALEMIDDGGSHVSIFVDGPFGVQVGRVIALPVSGHLGVAIASLQVDLSGGRTLTINGTAADGSGVISIGHIIVTGADGASAINVIGNVEVDVWRIEERSLGAAGGGGGNGNGFSRIVNLTPGGDFVAVDVTAVTQFSIDGNLGRTQVPAYGPQHIGPRLGLATSLKGAVGDALGAPRALFDTSLGDNRINRAINDATLQDGSGYLDDVGGPFDGLLEGLVVRSGNVQQVRSKGAMGDVILQGATATLGLVTANYDVTTAFGGFDGIIGTIFAFNITTVDVGDGLAAPEPSPLSTTGIFSINNIGTITTSRLDGAVTISGPINAANSVAENNTVDADGLRTITIANGQIRNAFIGARDIDGFWQSFLYGDDNRSRGDIGDITVTTGNIFSSEIDAANIRNVTITNGFFDASRLRATANIGNVRVNGFRNSTLTGSLDELNVNEIVGAGNADTIQATNDMNDLSINLTGRIKVGLSAANIARSSIAVNNQVIAITVTGGIRSTAITVGELPSITARDFYADTIRVAGALTSMVASNTIATTRIEVSGPAGRLDAVTAANGIQGEIVASGPVTAVTSTTGDLDVKLTTSTSRGNVGTLTAGRDILLDADISGNVVGVVAGRNIGKPGAGGVILVRGDLATLTATGGGLYNEVRVGGSITGAVTLGSVVNKPSSANASTGSLVAFGAIKSVIVNSDYAGDITSYSGGITSILINNGSYLAGHTITAYDGSITSLSIVNGNLYGNVRADYDITLLSVAAGTDGIFGDVGVNPTLSASVRYDDNRNQLPPGVREATGIQGPSISAGRNIVRFSVVGGNVYEASVFAQRNITAISIVGNVSNDTLTTGIGSYFAAGDAITAVSVTGNVSNTAFLSGVVSLGADNRPGGTLTNADTIKSGDITSVVVTGRVTDSKFSAGMNAGADGVYNTADDTTALGVSTVATLTLGSVGANVSVFGDTLSATVTADGRFTKGGTTAANSNSLIVAGTTGPGVSFNGTRTFTYGAGTVTIGLTGPGTAIFDASTGTLRLINTSSGGASTGGTSGRGGGTSSSSAVTISSSTGTLNNFSILSNDDAGLSALTINAAVTGASNIAIDGAVTALTLGQFNSTGKVFIGGDVVTLTAASIPGGQFDVRSIGTLTISGQFGATDPNVTGEAVIHALSTGAISITGADRGTLSVDRDTASLTVGSFERALSRFGSSVGAITAASSKASVLSAGDSIGAIAITGDFADSAVVGGADFGIDAFYGGTGLNADRISTGSIGAVSIGGNFTRSDIVTGYARGADGFYGTSDDNVAPGRGSIASVTIGGTSIGSTRSTETFRIASNGTVGPVRVGGSAFTGSRGNFAVEIPALAPAAGEVLDIVSTVDSRIFTANIVFNQPIDYSSIATALSVSEVRGNGDIEIRLVQGVDYTTVYDAANNTLKVVFSKGVTERNLPAAPDKPGPGIYRFGVQQSLFRAKLLGAGIDGNGDGFSRAGDNYSGDAIIGDAGDKINPVVTSVSSTVNNITTTRRVDLYGATNLNFVMDANSTADNLPDVNKPYTLRGYIGDHPDNDATLFRFAGDVDVYSITLQAGQILRMGKMLGTANLATVALYDSTLTAQPLVGITNTTNSLPPPDALSTDTTFARAYLIQQTGTYYIVVGNAGSLTDNTVPNPDQFPLRVGDYNMSLEVFDDGDSGFTSNTDSGDGTSVVTAPPAQDFAGSDGVLGTADDLAQIVTNGFSFTRNSATNTVTGNNAKGISSSRDASGRLTSTVNAAIGPKGHAGVPSTLVASDVDVFHLNGRLPIAPGTKMRLTMKLSQSGADLGSSSPTAFTDNRGSVQFALFDTSNSTTVSDGTLVFSSTDFLPYSSTANKLIADNGSTKYGYDANGDFYVEFIVPSRTGTTNEAGTFAAYVQGVYNTDYTLEVVTDGTGTAQTHSQNVLLETNGGSIDWLQAGGYTTELNAFNINALGFNGTAANGLPAQTYLLNTLVANLNALYQGAGFDVRFSINAADFEFQPFSTVYLSSTSDPVFPIFNSFAGSFNLDLLTPTTFRSTQPYGFSQHSDVFNANLSDDAVVFVPSFAAQGLVPSLAGLDQLTQSLTGAVSRRVGELVGLRMTANNAAPATTTTVTNYDPMAANSPELLPGTGRSYSLSNLRRRLSTDLDSITNTNFFLGNQNSVSLLDQVLTHR
jgi:hypothetical protein